MSILSRFYKKVIFKNYKKLVNVNHYYSGFGAQNNFLDFLRKNSLNLKYRFTDYSYSPHNPLIFPSNSMRWICEAYHSVFDYIEKNEVKSLLEIGCGFGIAAWIMKDGVKGQIDAIDINPEPIYVAKKIFKGVNFQNISFEDFLKKQNKKYDLIVACNAPFFSKQNQEKSEQMLDYCDNFIRVGYRAKKPRDFLFWEHKMKGKQLSFASTLVSKKKSYTSFYIKYYFTWYYLNCLIHAIKHRYFIPI